MYTYVERGYVSIGQVGDVCGDRHGESGRQVELHAACLGRSSLLYPHPFIVILLLSNSYFFLHS